MFRKYASYIVAFVLIILVAGACIVRSSRPAHRRGGPVYVEKHKHKKHKHKHKKHKHRRR
jgi:ABC-type nickel/cobalt efflux system permease component RcnA